MTALPAGVVAPNLTPFNDDLSVATDLYIEHAHRLLADGCGGLAAFGTSGEALSVSIEERIAAVDALISSGVPPDRLIVGTGLTNLPDTATLTRHAMAVGCAAAMVLPPFYVKNPSDDGLFDYFDALIHVLDGDVRIVLYHIPPVAIVGFSQALVARLRTTYPDQIVAIKDSSGDWSNTSQLYEIDGLTVYPGSELPLIDAMTLGGDRVITATANLNAVAIDRVMQTWAAGDRIDAAALHEPVVAARHLLSVAAVPAQKRILALRHSDERWANVRPPLLPFELAAGRDLAAELDRIA